MDVHQNLSYGVGWSQRANRPIFNVKRNPQQLNLPFCQFSCAIVHGSFSDPDVLHHFYRNISWTFMKTFAMEHIGLDGKTSPFSRSNKPRSASFADPDFQCHFGQKFSWTSVKTLPMELVDLDG
ncbi:hypothetical protein H5410_056527 [Solanum commersonii]|uniref:Uncharacterized protein n=1 Tax=Solanum commersonii TaxID=4109 RepID=A0A9J5WKG6_SOLCO|nr:hypothetical protein H5410_056527 [Solanum commersonii]